ncbi:MAG: protein kinase, partial [Clostridiaceae bacterium]|nr:protein kinase [Clostridiaceae bacterium]
MISNRHHLAAGTLLGDRYEIVKLIGQGGMAMVYLAKDQQNGGSVAIKVMKAELSNDQEFIKRFDTEARAASSLDHPNIVKVLDHGQDG